MNGSCLMSVDELIRERYELAVERVREIEEDAEALEPYASYFQDVAEFILKLDEFLEIRQERDLTPSEYRKFHDAFYVDIAGEAYGISFTNPAFLTKLMGEEKSELAGMLAFLYAEIRELIPAVYEGRLEEITVTLELFLEIYGLFGEEIPGEDEVRDRIYWYAYDYLPLFLGRRIKEQLQTEESFGLKEVMRAAMEIEKDPADTDYLYRFGEYITDNDHRLARYVNSLPEEDILKIARTYTEGYRIGFVKTGKDLSIKKTVAVRFQLGFERVVSEAVKMFEAMGLKTVIYRASMGVVTKNGQSRVGFYGSIPNQQYDYDHAQDAAIFLDSKYLSRRIEVLKEVYEENREAARYMAGPAVIELFGEVPFAPVSKPEITRFSDKQKHIKVKADAKASAIVNKYIPGEERSFTIISFPNPGIGDRFEEIFSEVVKVNTLDADLYEKIQQKLIDVLDTGERVHITGRNGNRTDMYVELYKLKDPAKETIFENCVADVNIPVGEVFTSPVLKGTHGILHVTGVFLDSLFYKNLEITFKDGMIDNYTCENFETEEENRRYINDNVMNGHKTLPLGEFAIGTNTTAAVMIDRYNIADRMTILIAEKTGPHFAVGDTCYSHEEDVRSYNPDGKYIAARENECSALRHTDLDKAYFQCHTDITIPYDELGTLEVIREDGESKVIIRDGRFVLEGTELLNEPFEDNR